MLALANLQIVNPERIILLLTSNTNNYEVCNKMSIALKNVELSQKHCKPLEDNNLYMLLLHGLTMAHIQYCKNNEFRNAFMENIECYKELHEEYIDCEGPADWFENSNETKLCE